MQTQTLSALHNAIMEAGGKDRPPRANQDNSPRINKSTGYDNQRIGNVAGARETVEQANWRDDTNDEPEDQELEAHYMYMAQIQEVTSDADDKSGPIFDSEPLQKIPNNDNYNVFAIESEHPEQSKSDDDDDLANERNFLASLIEKLKCEIDDSKNRNKFLKTSNMVLVDKLQGVIPPTSVSRPQLKSNQIEDRVMLNNSQGKKQEVEDHCRNVKFSKNKTSVTASRRDYPIHYRLWMLKAHNGNLKLLTNFVEKFLGTVKFGIDQIVPILGYGDLVQGTVTIKRVYYFEGLNHNLFSVGQFCDADLEVAFRKSTCYIRDLKGNDLLTGSHGTDLYSITLQDTSSPNPIYLMAKATSSQAWLSHRHLSHLNFDTINLLLKNDIVISLPKLNIVKDHLCSSCELRKAKRKSFQTKTTPSSKRWLQLLHMDLCGPIRVERINGKKYVLVIIDDYSRYTWTYFLRSKDETPEVLIVFIRLVQRGLYAQVRIIQTYKGTEFLNKTLHAYFASKGINHQTSVARTPEQNDVTVHLDGKNLDKMKEKVDACIYVGYSTQSRAYRVFNKRTRVIMETIHVNFDESPQMASNHVSSDPVPQYQRTELEHDSLRPGPQSQKNVPRAAGTVTTSNELDLLFSPMFDELLNGSTQVVSKSSDVTPVDAPNKCQQHHTTPLNTQTTPEPTCQVPTQAPTVTSTENINQAKMITDNAQIEDDEFINIFWTPVQDRGETSSRHNKSLEILLNQLEQDVSWNQMARCEELHQFDRLDVWELVDIPLCKNVINMKWLWKNKHDEENTVIRNKSRLVLRDMLKSKELISKNHLHQLLGWKPSGYSLRIQIHQSPRGIFINQAKYAQEILIKHGMTSCDSIGTPMATKHLDADLSGTPVDQTKYRGMVRALMYLTASRLDVVHATCYCALYQTKPTEKHLTVVKQIFLYLKDTINMGLWYLKDIGFKLTAFSDLDYAGCLDSRKSTSGAEAEYVSLSACCAQFLWLRTQLTDYGFHFDKIPMYCDSKAAIAISCNPVQHSRTKHIDVRYHFIKENIEKGIIELFFVRTEYQLADLFTKALSEDRLKYLVRRMV
nr:retrovirus-related Pol polyprotein from transposon TNT 1-94 [Tanacetum cinerariifolium]